MHNWLNGAAIRFEAPASAARPNTIYAGTQPQSLPAGLAQLRDGSCLILSNAGGSQHAVTRVVADAQHLDEWRNALALGAGDAPFAGKTLVVEDASPDTCLALVTFARRLGGQAVPQAWIDFAERWESGDTTSTGAPETSWGALHSALVHGILDPLASDRTGMVTQALIEGCRLVQGLLEAGVQPEAVPDPGELPRPVAALVTSARAALAATRDVARTTAATSTVVQLDIPIASLRRRRRTVDAIVVIDRAVVDAKGYLRRDPTSPSGHGFAFMALHRPSERGTGNDVTFSVDPASGVWLKDLWIELERLEWEAWAAAGEDRPENPPRPIASFMPDGGGSPLSRPCVQPWYDTKGDYTLVAGPRDLPDGRAGSKLTWGQSLSTVWRFYAPISALALCTRADGSPVDFFQGTSEAARPVAPNCPALRVSHLRRTDRHADAVWTETIARTCAAFLSAGRTAIDRLPNPRDFDVVSGPAGYVIVSNAGAMTVEIASDAGFPFGEICAAIEEAAGTLQSAINLEKRLVAARRNAVEVMEQNAGRAKADVLAELYAVLADALERRSEPPSRPEDPFIAALSEALERRWRAAERFRAVIEETSEVRDMVVASSEVRANEMIGAIAVYGFPFAALVNFFAFAFSGSSGNIVRGWELLGLEIKPVIAWIFLSLLLAFGLHMILRRRERAWRKQLRRNRQPDS